MRTKPPSCSTGRGFAAAQMSLFVSLRFQLFGVCRPKAPSALRAQTGIRNTTNARGASAMASSEPLTPDFTLWSHRTSERSAWLWWFLTCHHWSKRLLRIERAFQPARLQVLSIQPEYRFLKINTYSLSWCGWNKNSLRRTVLLAYKVKVC